MPRQPPLVPERLEAYALSSDDGDELVVLALGDAVRVDDPRLTPAEREVAALVIGGSSNADIAEARGTSIRTVENQVARLLDKVGASSRVDLVARLAGRG